MQTTKTLIIGLFIYGLSNIGISAKSLEDPLYSNVAAHQSKIPAALTDSFGDIFGSVPNNTPSASKSTPTSDNTSDANIPSKVFVSSMFSNRDIYVEFLKHLHTSLALNDNFKALNDFLSTKCSDKCNIRSIFAVLNKLRTENLFFWIGKYRTTLKFNDRGQTFTVFITNGAKVNNGKVADGSVFINNIPIYNATFKNRQLTWNYDTGSILSNSSKGDLTFADIFVKDSYIGHNFLGTLMVNSKITGKEESYRFTGFSRIWTPTKLSARKRSGSKNKSNNKSGSASGSTSGSESEGALRAGNDPGNSSGFGSNISYHPKPMGVGMINYKTHLFGSQVWTVENMRHFPTKLMTGIFTGDSNDIKYYEWASAMDEEVEEGSQGICASGWRIPTDADWKKLESYFKMSPVQQNKNNTYRGKDQASMLNQGWFNAELLGFFRDNNLQEKGKKVYFVSSSKSTKAGHFIGRKISTVPVSAMRFVLIKKATPGQMAIGEVEVMYQGRNIARHKKVTVHAGKAYTLFHSLLPDSPSSWVDAKDIVDGNVNTGFLSDNSSSNGWVTIDLGAEYRIESIKIKDLIHQSKRIPAKELAIFTSKKAINAYETIQELRTNPEIESVGVSMMRPSSDPDHHFIITDITLDLWRGDIDNSIGSSVRCIQNDIIPNLVAPSIENNIKIGERIKPIVILDFAPGVINKWSISPALDNGLVFDTKTGTISGTPNKLQMRKKYTVTATNDKGPNFIDVYITILPILIDNIEVSGNDVLVVGKSTQLSATISPSNASNKTLSWLANDTVSIDNKTGEVTGLKEGIASIRAISNNGLVVGRFEILVVDSQTIVFDKKPYKVILSEATGKIWLDRNLGASQVCKTVKDADCYGDLYQWGRGRDGHQSRAYMGKTTTLASSITPNNSNFIISTADKVNDIGFFLTLNRGDWTAVGVDDSGDKRMAVWGKTGVNNICPANFRVPTSNELKAEIEASTAAGKTGINTLLKLPLSGNRNSEGELKDFDYKGFYWAKSSDSLELDDNGDVSFPKKDRIQGLSVRCIKYIKPTVPIIVPSVEQLTVQIGESITPITFANFGANVTQWFITKKSLANVDNISANANNPFSMIENKVMGNVDNSSLASGLSFDSHTGTISGRANNITLRIYYEITATNSFGTDSAIVSIAVNPLPVPVTSIQLSHNAIQIEGKSVLKVGESIQLSAGITPGNATNQGVLWSVNSNHVTMSKSKGTATLTGVSTGVVELYATSLDGGGAFAKLTIHIVEKIFKGKIYNTVVSVKNRMWLDRNLGASQVCIDARDSECYGDLYQFGRPDDGHQRRINTNIQYKQAKTIKPNENTFFVNEDVPQVTTTSVTTTDKATLNPFTWFGASTTTKVTVTTRPPKGDWTVADKERTNRANFWSDSSGNGICPTGFRVPTPSELIEEALNTRRLRHLGPLRLPMAGKRHLYDGVIKNEGTVGSYWSQTYVEHQFPKAMSFYLLAGNTNLYISTEGDANGYSVRCIADLQE
ncbi:hypothetical protein MS2017_0607 [Bathymodiolus thermophilus thioautotrophic gill symbiont]|uniref:BIG2 domain-containing protein n=1 Tax=Bathymodiolus thermophilus thioautotrophic gill symbiont TaxID=2360 RepID=A0A3G3IKR4_9GAMM|nr:FISUMP domain-containing protein [Bathymodiolus thermophilus thioautotrophic gill symbiont]AYQ56341.1 hypothetical protein MS2017_0607 [Bathymodiolus thermophilus thioautotrophic gill symbiont]